MRLVDKHAQFRACLPMRPAHVEEVLFGVKAASGTTNTFPAVPPAPHLLGLGPVDDLQALGLADGHLHGEGDPHVAQVLRPRVEGDALAAAHVLPAGGGRRKESAQCVHGQGAGGFNRCRAEEGVYSWHHSVGSGSGSLGFGGSAASFCLALLKAYWGPQERGGDSVSDRRREEQRYSHRLTTHLGLRPPELGLLGAVHLTVDDQDVGETPDVASLHLYQETSRNQRKLRLGHIFKT